AAASAAVHFSELGTSLVSGISHHRFGNVDWRTVGILAGPGFIGAVLGSTFLASLDGEAATPWISGILLALGVYVIWRFLALGGKRPEFKSRPSAGMLVPVGFVGGARCHRRWRLGSGRDDDAALIRTFGAPEGHRVDRYE
ncbi:sulfite exporter TauE/SafE family protein, partial [Brevibacterium epidermidis]|uniref:sulfite exporter TauE/SafE family protein n=1 Tax=Brevibacterium epidermidis TaxID=1698 RepID=UPI0030D47F6D